MRKFNLLAGVLALVGVVAVFPEPASAKLGASLDSSVKLARTYKKDVMGVQYAVHAGKVVCETWSSEMSGWKHPVADRFRWVLVGNKRLKSQIKNARGTLFTYVDGTRVQYNELRGKVITLDDASPSFSATAKYQKVNDWKEAPWKGRRW